jgi:hypothetical protein
MTIHPKHNITMERATDLLKDGRPLTDIYLAGELKINTNDIWDNEVVFENCIVECFSGTLTIFNKPVRLTHSHFNNCQFLATYFLSGLTIDNCTFDNYLDFQSGGHNKAGKPIILTNNNFTGFVNFFDCWYEGEVTISNNKFLKGTNLLGKPNDIPVSFDIEPIIRNNVGQLELDNEGEISE